MHGIKVLLWKSLKKTGILEISYYWNLHRSRISDLPRFCGFLLRKCLISVCCAVGLECGQESFRVQDLHSKTCRYPCVFISKCCAGIWLCCHGNRMCHQQPSRMQNFRPKVHNFFEINQSFASIVIYNLFKKKKKLFNSEIGILLAAQTPRDRVYMWAMANKCI